MRKSTTTIAAALAILVLVSAALTACGASSQSAASAAPAASSSAPGGLSPLSGQGGSADAGGPGGSADTSAAKTTALDLAYADASASQKLDIYLPATGNAPYPVILAIHGGAFIMGDKADGQLTPMLSGLSRGYAVVSMNYRLSNEAKFPAQVNDVKAAVRWLRAIAAKYHLDANKIAVWGGSAGGNLAAMAGTSAGVAALSDPTQGNAGQSDTVQAVVDWFGPIAFLQMDPEFTASSAGPANHDAADSPESQYLGAALPTVPAKVKAADPTTYVTSDDPAFFIEHGTADGNVPVQQSQKFAAALTKTLGADNVTLTLLQGAAHADAAFTTPANVKLVLDWLDATLK